MKHSSLVIAALAAAASGATPAAAQEAGDAYVRVAAARTKLVDNGVIKTNGVVDPTAGYKTRDAYHGVLTGGYFVIDGVAIEGSISTPATTNNVPAGSLAGLPNLGDDEFTTVTLGGVVQPFKGKISPFIGGGFIRHFTTQERDGLGVNLNIPNANGPYVEAGVDFNVTPKWGVFASVRKSWYDTHATGLLPLDATFTTFATVDAQAELDPLTIQLGVVARFGKHADGSEPEIGADDTKWVVRGGITSLTLADKTKLTVGGAPFPGAEFSTNEHWTPTVQVGYFLTPNLAVNFMGGIPPKITVHGGGTIGALPALGRVRYGPSALTAQYHFTRSGRIRPWVGVGASYMIVFEDDDGAFQDLKVKNDLGPVFEAGAELMVSNKMGLSFDVKKALLRPKAYGTFGGAPVEADTRLDPWAFTGGLAFHF
jgi:outer membrane protein